MDLFQIVFVHLEIPAEVTSSLQQLAFLPLASRRMGEGNSFSLFVSSHLKGGTPSQVLCQSLVPGPFQGVPQASFFLRSLVPGLSGEGVPKPSQDGDTPGQGTPIQVRTWGGIPQDRVLPQPGMGYLPNKVKTRGGDTSGQGTPCTARDGVPPARSGWEYPRTGYPPLARDGVPPRIGQQRVYVLCGGQYASCIHATGLSCLHFFFSCLHLFFI